MANKKVNKNAINPKHYSRFKIEPVTFIVENKIPYCEANSIKYLCRWRFKHETVAGQIEDLNKAKQYIDILIADVKKECRDKKRAVVHVDPLQIIS